MSKPSPKILVILITAVLLLAGGGYYFYSKKTSPAAPAVAAAEEVSAPMVPVDPNAPLPPLIDYDEAKAPQWVKDALVEHSIGDPNAPVVIEDFSSLTCPHCADAHIKILPQLKKDYVDTGKVRFILRDFPLNVPALQAAALARCITDNDAYFAFVDQLFRTQAQWGQSTNAKPVLLSQLKFTGLSQDDANKCLNEPMLYAGILKIMDEHKTKYKIESTPYFIINEGKAEVRGTQPYEAFKAAIDPLLK